MPQLDPEVEAPAIQLVGLEMSKEELMEIYLEVYKLHRLPGSPPGELAIWEEIMAKVPDHPCREEDQMHEAAVQSHPRSSHSSRSRTPCRRNDNSVGKTLTTVWEAHQKVLASVSTLEREIKRLHCTRAWSQSRARSKSRDCHRPSGEGQKRRCCQVRFADKPAPQPICWPQDATRQRRVPGQRLWLGGTARAKTNCSFLPVRVTRNFRWRGWGDTSGTQYYRL